MKFLSAAAITVCLTLVVGHSQPRSRKDQSHHVSLFRVSKTEHPSGKKRFGFIDRTGKLVIDFDRLPRNTIAAGDFHEGARADLRG